MAKPCSAWTLTHRDRPYPGHHLTFGQMAMAHDTLMPVPGLEVGMLAEELGDLSLYGLRQKSTGAVAKNFCQRVRERPWLDELDDGIVGHGVSLLCWRSGGVEHPHDTPPSSFHAVTNFRA